MCGLTTAEALLTEGRSAVNMLLDQILGFPYLNSLFCVAGLYSDLQTPMLALKAEPGHGRCFGALQLITKSAG